MQPLVVASPCLDARLLICILMCLVLYRRSVALTNSKHKWITEKLRRDKNTEKIVRLINRAKKVPQASIRQQTFTAVQARRKNFEKKNHSISIKGQSIVRYVKE